LKNEFLKEKIEPLDEMSVPPSGRKKRSQSLDTVKQNVNKQEEMIISDTISHSLQGKLWKKEHRKEMVGSIP
jgi:hypothetical protein